MDALKKKAIRLYEQDQRITYTKLANSLCISESDAQELILWVRIRHVRYWWYKRNFGLSKQELLEGKPPCPYIHKQTWMNEARKPRIGGYEKETPWSQL